MLNIAEGCHGYDLATPDATDPASVTAARYQGATLINQWVDDYNAAKAKLPLSNAADMFQLEYAVGGYVSWVDDTLPGSATGLFQNQSIFQSNASYSNSVQQFL